LRWIDRVRFRWCVYASGGCPAAQRIPSCTAQRAAYRSAAACRQGDASWVILVASASRYCTGLRGVLGPAQLRAAAYRAFDSIHTRCAKA